MLIQFDDPKTGEKVKDKNGSKIRTLVMVAFQTSQGYVDVEWQMLPLTLSWAVMVHKLQRTTLKTAVVNLGKQCKGPLWS